MRVMKKWAWRELEQGLKKMGLFGRRGGEEDRVVGEKWQ